jgi:cytochrome c oxidase subunit 4
MGFEVLILVWLSLLVLTSLTVALTGIHAGLFSIFLVLLIAGFKSSLVLNYFMHLKFEKRLIKAVVLISLSTVVLFRGLTFTDLLLR